MKPTARHLPAFVLVLLVMSLVVFGAGQAQNTVYDLDTDTPLTSDETIDQFDSNGSVTVHTDVPDLTVTVAQNRNAVGVTGYQSDFANNYIRVQYHETIPRTIRFYIPKQYFFPVTMNLDSLDGSTQAELVGVENNNYTSVEIDFNGRTDATFIVSRETGLVMASINESRSRTSSFFGIDLPTIGVFGGGIDWQYIDRDQFNENISTYAIEVSTDESLRLQYDTGQRGDPNWVPVPECERRTAVVCSFTKVDDDQHVYLLMRQNDPVAVRYKQGGGMLSGSGGFLNDAKAIPGRIMDDLGGIFG